MSSILKTYYKARFNEVFSIDNLHKIKDRGYTIYLDGKQSKVIHWASLFIDRSAAVYFDSFWIEYNPQKVLNKIRHKSINYNLFTTQSNDFSMCEFYFIAFLEHMIARKSFLDYINLFSRNYCKKNGKIIYKYFKYKYRKRKCKPWLQNKKNW